MSIAIADQVSHQSKNHVAAGYTNAELSGVTVFVQRGDRFGQMLLTADEARLLLKQLAELDFRE